MYSLQIQQQPQTQRECTGIQFNSSGKTGSEAKSNWIWSVCCCFQWGWNPKYTVGEENKGWTKQGPGSSLHHSCACAQGLGPAQPLCSAEAAAVFSSGCPLNTSASLSKAVGAGSRIKGWFWTWAGWAPEEQTGQWLAQTAPLACPSAASSYCSTATDAAFPSLLHTHLIFSWTIITPGQSQV